MTDLVTGLDLWMKILIGLTDENHWFFWTCALLFVIVYFVFKNSES